MQRRWLLGGVILLSVQLAQAQPLRMHRLGDGRRLEARVKLTSKRARLKTAFGVRSIPRALYAGVAQRSLKSLAGEYKGRAKEAKTEGQAGAFKLARWCRDEGYLSGLRSQLNRILLFDPDDSWAREQIRSLAREYRVHECEGGVRGRDQRKLARFLLDVLVQRDFCGAAIAAEKALKLPKDIVFGYAMDDLKHRSPRVRWVGARLLARHRDRPARINPLYRHALQDRALAVRRESVRSLAVTKDPVFTRLFGKNLKSHHSGIRVHAAQALAELGDKSALPLLAQALADGGQAPRNHVALRTQRAYVKDFDVEIAQAAVIADPVVDTVTEGIVLDVRVVSVNAELGAMRTALRRLSGGVDHGVDAAAWKRWIDSKGSAPK